MVDSHNRNIFGLKVRKNTHKDIRALKKQTASATIHGNKLWKSTSLLIDYLSVNPPKQGLRIMEIGCGWGIASIYCAKEYAASVTALDADAAVFPYLQYHADLNGVAVKTCKLRYEKITKKILTDVDMVIASDICFWDDMATPLLNFIRRCYQSGVQRVVITDPGREPFSRLAEQCLACFDAVYEPWSVPHPDNTSGWVLDIC